MIIQFKGSNFTLSVIHVQNIPPNDIYKIIQAKITQLPKFFKNAPIVINVSALNHKVNWSAILQAILSTGLYIVGVSGCNDSLLKEIIINSGLPILTEGKSLKTNIVIKQVTKKTRFINLPIRSGQQIYAHNSDLIVHNNVSAGAELIADGNIHIYGIMRGRALAGASGDITCQIFCTSLFTELISIAGRYWLSEQIPDIFIGKSIRLSLQDDILVVHPLI